MSEALVDTLSGEELDLLVDRGGLGAPRDDPNRHDDSMDRPRPALTPRSDAPPADGAVAARRASQSGLVVARRTAAKYRKARRIPSSRQRRGWPG